MTASDDYVMGRVELQAAAEFVSLARRCHTSQRQLGRHAVRQMLVAAKGGPIPDVPPLDPAQACHGIKLWLEPSEKTDLQRVANRHSISMEALATLALRHMLAQARAGALPMLKMPEPAPNGELPPLKAFWGRGDGNQQDTRTNLASANYSKALFTVARLLRLAEEGIDCSNPRAALEEIDDLGTHAPY